MKNIEKFLIIPLVALLVGVLPQRIVYADTYITDYQGLENLVSPYWATDVTGDKIKLGAEYLLECEQANPMSGLGVTKIRDFVDTLLVGAYPVELVSVDTYNRKIYYMYLTETDLQDTSNFMLYGQIISSKKTALYNFRYISYSYNDLVKNGSGTIGGAFTKGYSSTYLKVNKLDLRLLGLDNYLQTEEEKIEEEIKNHPIELPSTGNGILITAPKSGSKINKLEYNAKGYLEQIFTLRVQYKPKEGFFGLDDDGQKMDIIKGISCEMEDSDFNYHIFDDSFRWIVKPSKAVDSVSSPYAIAEIKISTVFKDLGRKKFIVNSALKVADDSEDITRDIRQYTDSIYVEFVSDENYSDGVVINPDGTTGSDGSNSDINLDGFPTSPGSNATIIDWVKYFGDVIIWLVTYPFKLLANCFTVLGVYITVMLKTLQSTSEQITGLFTFIPKDILNVTYGIISFTLLYSVIRGLLRLIRGN